MRKAHLPVILCGPHYPFTVYAPSRAHDSYVVAYGPHWPSAARWIVPGTHPELPDYRPPEVVHLEAANDEVAV